MVEVCLSVLGVATCDPLPTAVRLDVVERALSADMPDSLEMELVLDGLDVALFDFVLNDSSEAVRDVERDLRIIVREQCHLLIKLFLKFFGIVCGDCRDKMFDVPLHKK